MTKKTKKAKKTAAKTTVVSFPVSGTYVVELEGEYPTEREAIDAAWERFNEGDAGELQEWELHETMVNGNCMHFNHNEVSVDVYED